MEGVVKGKPDPKPFTLDQKWYWREDISAEERAHNYLYWWDKYVLRPFLNKEDNIDALQPSLGIEPIDAAGE